MMLLLILLPLLVALFAFVLFVRWKRQRPCFLHDPLPGGRRPYVIGFFHPYCNAGGGGERVLWTAITAIQNKFPHVHCVVYSGDIDANEALVMQRVKERFNMTLPRPVYFVWLHRRGFVEAEPYRVLTLLGQSLGSLLLGAEALVRFVPDLYIDTMGYAFTIPIFKYIGGCKVGCYVHYPTISTDMLERVSQRASTHNNASFISKSLILSSMKLVYYKLFAYIYGVAGKCSDFVMVNSTWTEGHILSLWQADCTRTVYPPCDTHEFTQSLLSLDAAKDVHSIISVSQFRPEKDHRLQVEAFSQFIGHRPDDDRRGYELVLMGSCRNDDDMERVAQLKELVAEKGIGDKVRFELNVPFAQLKKELQEATVGLHTMWNEHFGIGVVEMQAAGLIVLAHNSGGPKLDIVTEHNGAATGFLASDVDSYASELDKIFSLSDERRLEMRTNARASVERFSEERFDSNFLEITSPFIQ